MKGKPAISVVMSVYNGGEYLHDAIDSILSQTFTDFEFIIIDDGSTDQTLKIIKQYRDPRIRLVSRENRGLIASLNEGVDLAKADYIARQDADDISKSYRLEKLHGFLETNKDVGIVGSEFEMISDKGEVLAEFKYPGGSIDAGRALFVRNPLSHGSVLMRRDMLVAVAGYRGGVGPIEDYDLWVRLYSRGYSLAIFPEVLYSWRHNLGGVSSLNTAQQAKLAAQLRANLWEENSPASISVLGSRKRFLEYKRSSHAVSRNFVQDQLDMLRMAILRRHYNLACRQALICSVLFPGVLYVIGTQAVMWYKVKYHQLRRIVGIVLRNFGWNT